ncbi:two-partner secretion domain-containing protein [Scytonema sp. PRP1]|uniref:two-partner secretion domain-containing protein n=1 Tax=Scytonema sp. PRP1 TaxID=3120513 RepID=UPI00300CBF52
MITSWKNWGSQLALASCVIVGGAIASANCAFAQITPDGTLPNNSRVITQDNIRTIEGGTQAGGNLFHSFREFSVPTGGTAFFNNAQGIQNIISRVTGGSVSNIDGLIRANGTANLFLINPNGIVFGRNASLNIGGSFVATTASSLKFADGSQFSAIAAQSTPLLTISVPMGLQYGANPGSIQVQGDGQGLRSTSELIDTTSGLWVQPNQTLALVGGDVSLEGATLKTAGGRIELGSVGHNSLVSLTPINKGFALGYDTVQNFGNIQLSQQAAVDASGAGGGDIQVMGRRVTLTNGSQIEASTLGAEQGGNLVVNAQDSVQLIGISADSQFPTGLFANAYPSATGAAGNLRINTRELLVRDGGQVSASTYGAGNAGNLTVRADSVQLIGASSNGRSRSSLLTETSKNSTGAAGDLTINTRELLAQNGAFVGARTFGAGNAGNLTVNADSVQLTGNSLSGDASALIATSEEAATGAAGNLTINTSKLSLEDGAQVSAGTWGPLKGGT